MSFRLRIEIRYAPGGDENVITPVTEDKELLIEIRYAPGGDENGHGYVLDDTVRLN